MKGVVDSIKVTTDPAEAVESTDLVIEAIIENLKIKKELFGLLDSKAPKDAVFASNTSSLNIAEIAEATSRRSQFGGTYRAAAHRRFPRVQPRAADEAD